MGLLAGLERRLARLIEGGFARFFRGGLHPRAIPPAVVESLHAEERDGAPVATNGFIVSLSLTDHRALGPQRDELAAEALARVEQQIAQKGWALAGRLRVRFEARDDLPAGELRVSAGVAPGPGDAELVPLARGPAFRVPARGCVVGRDPGCDLVLDSSDVSREHARLEPRGPEFVLIDLQSTNGTRVNGNPVTELPLRDSDVIAFGPVQYRFREC
ncbi:MAG: DUF3662 and FHA domain-containing protein [Armatimonadetes bacterium]|nr:DUF3662 and FHA domain-containing protein [Armatimonadota bacterium]